MYGLTGVGGTLIQRQRKQLRIADICGKQLLKLERKELRNDTRRIMDDGGLLQRPFYSK